VQALLDAGGDVHWRRSRRSTRWRTS
jgi:hypothetical protein